MKVGIFLSTCSENKEKKKYLEGFAEGIASVNKDKFFLTQSKGYKDCDIAVVFGFFGISVGDIHRNRKNIYTEHTIKRKKNCIFIDADLFRFLGTNTVKDTTHVRISYGSIFFDHAIHFNEKSDPSRWNLIKKRKGISVLDYREEGEHILLCLNSNPHVGKGWSAGKVDIYNWAEMAILGIRKHTDKKIIVRFHPNAKDDEQKKIPIKKFEHAAGGNIFFSGGVNIESDLVIKNTTLANDCKDAWACVVHNTSASTTPVIYGIPVFTNMKNCPVYNIANHNLSLIEDPELFDRTQWLNDTAYCLWNYEEIRQGIVWERFRNRLTDNGEYSKKAAMKLGL